MQYYYVIGERKKRPRGGRKSEAISMQLTQAITTAIKKELYPRSQIDVYLEVLQVRGLRIIVINLQED